MRARVRVKVRSFVVCLKVKVRGIGAGDKVRGIGAGGKVRGIGAGDCWRSLLGYDFIISAQLLTGYDEKLRRCSEALA